MESATHSSVQSAGGLTASGRRTINGSLRSRLFGGGTDGNGRLTAMAGALLFVLLAVLGVSILRIQQLISLHLFLGLLLLGPVTLKLASTGYRFMRYYIRSGPYVVKGPPATPMRLLAPIVVLLTLVVFASGVLLLVEGPASRGNWLFIHKASFILWLGATAVHVVGHLPEMTHLLVSARARERRGNPGLSQGRNERFLRGGAGRWIAFSGAIVVGVVIAIALIPDYSAWSAASAFAHSGH